MILVTNNEGYPGADTTARLLAEGRAALDAIEAGVRLVEADERVRTVGRGGWANILGEVELDAAVMDGASLRSGAVGAVRGFLHPVSIARAVMEKLPHELLVGPGAEMFAREIGAEPAETLLPHARQAWEAWFAGAVKGAERERWPEGGLIGHVRAQVQTDRPAGTTVFIARDRAGGIASGASTSGWQWKYPGRLGDTPIIGAGSYADRRYGAAACTGVGEMAIRCGTARAVVLYMKQGASVHEAVEEAVEDMRAMAGGLIGRITIHAIDSRDNFRVVAVNGDARNAYWLWQEAEPHATRRSCEAIAL
ncbi:MAG: isoaspartyl peptidase/L-asparaginase [Rhodospirillales bacterium]|nr:isoaspartyl peptidase/L-asparaginase [Rhodospirillales bacterium]